MRKIKRWLESIFNKEKGLIPQLEPAPTAELDMRWLTLLPKGWTITHFSVSSNQKFTCELSFERYLDDISAKFIVRAYENSAAEAFEVAIKKTNNPRLDGWSY